ncbi:PepSY-associated TM helix domain-containing protein [Pseudomonas putida]
MMAAPRAAVQRLHAGAGALAGLMLFVILFSGAWSLGHEAMRDWLRAPRVSAAPLDLDQLLLRARQLGMDDGEIQLRLANAQHPDVELCANARQCAFTLAADSGQVLAPVPEAELLYQLHTNLFLGFPGRVLVGLFGVALILLVWAGSHLHSRRLRDMKRLRRDRGLRVMMLDAHTLIGRWCLPWLWLFAITGTLSGLGALGMLGLAGQAFPGQPNQAFMQLMGAPPTLGASPAALPSAEQLLALDRRLHPSFKVQTVSLHHWHQDDGWAEVAGIAPGTLSTALFERHRYGRDGRSLGDITAVGRDLWQRLFIAVQPLHFGDYRWLPLGTSLLRGLQLVSALGAALLTLSGLYLWLERRRREARLGWHLMLRASVGVAGGLLLASAVLLGAAQVCNALGLGHASVARWFWGTWALWLLITLVAAPGRAGLATALIATGALGCLAVALRAVLALNQGGTALDAVGLSLLSMGLASLLGGRRLSRRTPVTPYPLSET